MSVTVRRYSSAHTALQVTVRGRGLYYSRTPDGTWWRLRLRKHIPNCPPPVDPGDSGPDIGVREPRRPLGPGPLTGASTADGC
jgi:hypothetical protein